MKRTLFVAVILLSFTSVSAQFNFGIKAGYNSSLSANNFGTVFDGSYNLNSVQHEVWNNFHMGAFARFIKKKFYIEPSILYSLEKKQYEITLDDLVNNEITPDKFAEIKTIDVPILFGIKLLDLRIANIRAFAGPKLRFDAGSTPRVSDVGEFISDVKKANLGFELGAGVDVLMFALDLQYNLIGDMYETKIENVKFDPSSTFVVSLAWKLF
ncbi:MAG TPA: outer membrane beta-barrel protein [Paludibacter sp.]|nr:outer membrane beta-barrel protein [Paludibacter sp.]